MAGASHGGTRNRTAGMQTDGETAARDFCISGLPTQEPPRMQSKRENRADRAKAKRARRRYCPTHLKRIGTADAPGVCPLCGAAGETRPPRRAGRSAQNAGKCATQLTKKLDFHPVE